MGKTTLTLKEALEQGYTQCLYSGDGFQRLMPLDESDFIKWDRGVELVEKKPYHPAGIDAKDLAVLVADNLEDNHSSESGDDTNEVYNTISKLDFSSMARKINKALKELNYYKSTGIILIPDPL